LSVVALASFNVASKLTPSSGYCVYPLTTSGGSMPSELSADAW